MDVRVGISGYDYPGWRGAFYPPALPRRLWLAYAGRCFNSVELNGTFYSLKRPAHFQRWADVTPEGFLFTLKGGRFITHNLKLRRCEAALGNFFASGPLLLGKKLGPILWQLPEGYRFDAERMASFMYLLPRTAAQATAVARGHDQRLRHGAWVHAPKGLRLRHAFEVRHPSYFHPEFYAVLREKGCGFVIADTAGRFPQAHEVTADFVYVRLHGSRELYVSGYTPGELEEWACHVRGWAARGLDVYVYFDNDAKVFAPRDALELAGRVGLPPPREPLPLGGQSALSQGA